MEELSFVVFMASHWHCYLRFELIKKAIISLSQQSKLPDHLYISISADYSNVTSSNMINELVLICKETNINNTVYFHETRKYQFDHYHHIVQNCSHINSYILFLDDDDLYHKDRIYEIDQHIKLHNKLNLPNDVFMDLYKKFYITDLNNIDEPSTSYETTTISEEDSECECEKLDNMYVNQDFANTIIKFDKFIKYFDENSYKNPVTKFNYKVSRGILDVCFIDWLQKEKINQIKLHLYLYRKPREEISENYTYWDKHYN